MTNNSSGNMKMLHEWSLVDAQTLDSSFPMVYNELKRMASKYLHAENKQVTLRTTDLVHETYIKLAGGATITLEDKAHFFGLAARSMRQILIDLARKRKAQKRGGDLMKVSLNEGIMVLDEKDDKILDLHEALNKLEGFDERLGRIVELRYFSGMTIKETAVAINCSPATVKRDWNIAKAWLYRELKYNNNSTNS